MNTPILPVSRPDTLDESYVDIAQIRLFTRAVGAGPTCVVLHGGPGAHHDYLLPQFDALAIGRRLQYYDQRGGGRSPAPREASVDWRAHVADLGHLLDHWNLAAATLVGYSWGGLLAMLFAVAFPERVSRLALISPAPAHVGGRERFERAFGKRTKAPALVAARAELKASGLQGRDTDAYRRRLFELSVAAYFRDPSNVRALTPFRVTGRTQTAVWESLGQYDLRTSLGALSVPAIVLHGRHDPIPLDTAEETARLLGTQVTVMEHSGHVPYVEDRELFVKTLHAFLPRAG